VFSSYGSAIAWNGSMWVAVGVGGLGIAYSYDGINWTGTGITSGTLGIAWSGSLWVAVGSNFILYSSNGISWTSSASNPFSTRVNGVASNGTRWVAVGQGTNNVAYSNDGINWTGILADGNTFTEYGYAVAWNGSIWVAVGEGTNSIIWSSDGITWNPLGTPIFATGYGVIWNGIRWIVIGKGTNTIGISYDGITWYVVANTLFSLWGTGIAANPNVGPTIVDSAITLNSNVYPQTNNLDIVSSNYYNNGYTNFSVNILSSER